MLFCNADPDASGHTPALIVRVIADCDAIDKVAEQFRALLAQQWMYSASLRTQRSASKNASV